MIIEIDQSGKIENTNRNTIIAFSNSISKSIFIAGKDKREIQDIFREAEKPKVFVYRLFAILIFILIKKYIKQIDQIIIDLEYPGKSSLIKNYLSQEIRKIRPNFSSEDIIFRRIGKKSEAHNIAYLTFKKRIKPNIVAGKGDILNFVIK
ncbi:hypothetical protein KKC65_02280 [Patescibacteria group bacterium]|nr:hypothetical protein [Patescibacteria group bacterium]